MVDTAVKVVRDEKEEKLTAERLDRISKVAMSEGGASASVFASGSGSSMINVVPGKSTHSAPPLSVVLYPVPKDRKSTDSSQNSERDRERIVGPNSGRRPSIESNKSAPLIVHANTESNNVSSSSIASNNKANKANNNNGNNLTILAEVGAEGGSSASLEAGDTNAETPDILRSATSASATSNKSNISLLTDDSSSSFSANAYNKGITDNASSIDEKGEIGVTNSNSNSSSVGERESLHSKDGAPVDITSLEGQNQAQTTTLRGSKSDKGKRASPPQKQTTLLSQNQLNSKSLDDLNIPNNPNLILGPNQSLRHVDSNASNASTVDTNYNSSPVRERGEKGEIDRVRDQFITTTTCNGNDSGYEDQEAELFGGNTGDMREDDSDAEADEIDNVPDTGM